MIRKSLTPTMNAITTRAKVWYCLIGNIVTMIMALTIVCVFRTPDSTYFRIGPSSDLVVISVAIDTWQKWILLNIFICLVKGCDVLVNEIGTPILGFSVYNPDKRVIDEFSKNELNFLANAMFFVNGIRAVLMAVVTVTQADIAFIGMFTSEFVSVFTTRHLLNAKTFTRASSKKNKCDDDDLLIV